jgi:phosphoribosylanthranilate isomerase
VSHPAIKICGVTSVDDAIACAELGADSIGLNFWPKSKRRCPIDVAARVVDATDVRVVGVFVDASLEEIARVRSITGIEWVQLHGDEPVSVLEALLPHAYRAVRPATDADVDLAIALPGDELLIDAFVPGIPGGTGQLASWTIAERIARARRVWLAGGLTPDNVAAAITAVRPFGADVASGVESAPGIKDLALVERFVRAARGA